MRRVQLKLLTFIFAWNALIGVSFGASGLTAGIPSLPCDKIIDQIENVQIRDWINFWIKGFWTGQNWSNHVDAKPLKNLDDPSIKSDALKVRIVAYCYENPQAVLMQVAIEFYLKLPALPADVKFR